MLTRPPPRFQRYAIKMYRRFPTGGRVVLPANASRVRNNFWVSTQFVRYRERCEQGCSHDRRQDGSGTLKKCTAGFQPAVALCFQPTPLESEIPFGLSLSSSAIANGVSKDAHTTAAKMAAVRINKRNQ
jgi:hypothetical protein